MLMEYALNNTLHDDAVYWFKDEETPVLYFDYYLLKERAGVDLIELEDNILRISERIKKREFYILTLIQTKWRGTNARWFYLVYQRELNRIREIQVSCAIKIQKNFRTQKNMIAYRKLKCHKYELALSNMYHQEVQMRTLQKNRMVAREKLKDLYKFYEQKKRTARLLKTKQQTSRSTLVSKSHFHNRQI